MSEKPNSLESLPSYGEGFKDYQRSAIPSSFARFDPKIEKNEEAGKSQSTKIRHNTDTLLAFQPRGRERLGRETTPKKKGPGRRRAKDEVLDNVEGENGDQTQNNRRPRPTRRAAPKHFSNVAEEADSDDEDFM